MLNVGVVGAGHLGKIHLKLLQQSNRYKLKGFFDVDEKNANALSNEFGYKFYPDFSNLLLDIDVLDIVTPTFAHFELAKQAIAAGKHVFIEKPITDSISEANELIQLLDKYDVKGQVGHVERFNPAFLAAKEHLKEPLFIESHRLAEFNPRGTDVPVVLDLMIHDLDVILSVVKSPVKEIRSSGVSVISDTPDIANARIIFENNCVANITTSRISMKNMRKTRFFQKDAYISVDFLKKKTEVIRIKEATSEDLVDEYAMILKNSDEQKKRIMFDYPDVEPNNAILEELESFADSIEKDSPIAVSFQDARNALKLALDIIDHFESEIKF